MMDGRQTEFADSALRYTLAFYTRQQGAGRAGYRPVSVLEPVVSSTLGFSQSDAQRLLPSGQILPSQNGSSEETYRRRTWLSTL